MTKTAAIKTLELWPLMGIHSKDTKHSGSWRLSVLAANMDHNETCDHANNICHGGSGKVLRRDLEAAALAQGVARSTYFYWLADAREAGILNGSGEWLYYASQERLKAILLCNTIDNSKAIIPARLLFKKGWEAVIWAAYLKANHHKWTGEYTKTLKKVYKGKVISALTLEDITGVKPRAQRRYKKQYKSRPNIGITTISGSYETAEALNQGAQEHGRNRHYFTFNDPTQKDPAGIKDYRRVIGHTMPSRRTVSDKVALIGARGRRAKILAANNGLQLVTFAIIESNYQARPQAGLQTEAQKHAKRYFDKLPSKRSRKEPAPLAAEAFILRPRRCVVGVWDRLGDGVINL